MNHLIPGRISRLIKKPVKIEFEGDIIRYEPSKQIQISDLFFRDFICQRCVPSCCDKIKTDLNWAGNEVYPSSAKKVICKINGKEKEIYIHRNKGGCDLLEIKDEMSFCTIHSIKPIHCDLPPIWIDKVKDKTIIIKRLIKRNWRFGCPMKLEKTINLKEDIRKLNRLKEIADYFEIETYLDEIISYLNKCLEIGKYEGTKII